MSSKFAIILQAGPGTRESGVRAFHALLYSKELKEKGSTVKVVFDGAATEWLSLWRTTEDPMQKRLAGFFEQLKQGGLAYVVCDYCSDAFGVKEDLKDQGEPLTAEYMDHPSVADLATEGYQLLVL